MNVAAFYHWPKQFSRRSGMYPLVEALGAVPVKYERPYRMLMARSWTLGHALQRFGNWYYGSEWNGLCPIVDDWRLYRRCPRNLDVAHFLWGEFAGPIWPGLMRRKARHLVGTFHATARSLPNVLRHSRTMRAYDAVTLMSETQRPFFEQQGIPTENIRVILHGVDTSYYMPLREREPLRSDVPIRGLLVGYTERDHEFMASVLKAMPPKVLDMTVLVPETYRSHYRDVPYAEFPGHLDDASFLEAYQSADLLIMPMLDCTANNVVLEAMACGTPVMINSVGGVPEYVDASCNWIMPDKQVDSWVDTLVTLSRNRQLMVDRRPSVRAWAERFDWRTVAMKYLELYRELDAR